MNLTAYRFSNAHPDWKISPASKEREWMDATTNRFAYRCLPLVMANQAGWVITAPVGFTLMWFGFGKPQKAMRIKFDSEPEKFAQSITSHFGYGILSFVIPMLFRTEPGVVLSARGLPNQPKTNCTPLEGIVETDWSPYTFTMNWKVQLPFFPVRFDKGEPICFLQPISLSTIENAEPTLCQLKDEPELHAEHLDWSSKRREFNENEAHLGGWQKHYFQGKNLSGESAAPNHRTNLRVKPFKTKDVAKPD